MWIWNPYREMRHTTLFGSFIPKRQATKTTAVNTAPNSLTVGSLDDGDIFAIQSPRRPERTFSGLVRGNISPGAFKKEHGRGLGPQSLWPIRERREAGFAQEGETEPISDSESRPVRLASRERRGRGLWPRSPHSRRVGGAQASGRGERCQRQSRMRAVPRPSRPWGWAEPQPPELVAAAAAGAGAATSIPARCSFSGRWYAGERGSRRWRRHQGAETLLRVVCAPGGEGAPCGRGVGLERRGRRAPGAPCPQRRGRRACAGAEPGGVTPAGARWGLRWAGVGTPGAGAGARAQGPACCRPGERARARKVLRPRTPLGTLQRSWDSGHRGRGRAGWSRSLRGLPGARRPGGSALPLECFVSLQRSPIAAACF